jgi:hypothetical protein
MKEIGWVVEMRYENGRIVSFIVKGDFSYCTEVISDYIKNEEILQIEITKGVYYNE